MVLGCLRGDPTKEITGYLQNSDASPSGPSVVTLRWCQTRFLRSQDPDSQAQRAVQKLSQQIYAGLIKDQKRQVEESGCTIKSLLASEPPILRETCVWMQGWYRDAANRAPPWYVYP